MVQGRQRNLTSYQRVARLRAKGYSGTAIARRLGMSHQAVYARLKGRGIRRGAAVCCACRATIPAPEGSNRTHDVLCRDCLGRLPEVPFGQRLVSLRIMAGLTQAQLASVVGVPKPQISALEQQRRKPHEGMRQRLLAVLESAPLGAPLPTKIS